MEVAPQVFVAETYFHFDPSSNPGTVITWKRDAISGISNPAVDYHSGPINEILINTSGCSINVLYTYNLNLNGCERQVPVYVTVVPGPEVTAWADPTGAICAGEPFNLFSSSPIATPEITILSEGFNSPTNNWTTINNSTGESTKNGTAWSLLC